MDRFAQVQAGLVRTLADLGGRIHQPCLLQPRGEVDRLRQPLDPVAKAPSNGRDEVQRKAACVKPEPIARHLVTILISYFAPSGRPDQVAMPLQRQLPVSPGDQPFDHEALSDPPGPLGIVRPAGGTGQPVNLHGPLAQCIDETAPALTVRSFEA